MDKMQINLLIGLLVACFLLSGFFIYITLCRKKSNKNQTSTLLNIKID